jgi:hypothetical protein
MVLLAGDDRGGVLGYRQPMDDGPPRRWRDARLRPWVTDGLLGVAVAAVQLLMLGLGVNQGGPVPYAQPNALAVLLILAQGLPLAWRRRWPLLVLAVVLAANTAYYAIAFPPSQFDFGLPIAMFTVAAERSQPTSLLACATILVLFVAQWAARVGAYWASANWVRVLYLVFFFSAVWAWGRYVRSAAPTPPSWPPGPSGPSATASSRRSARWRPSGPGSPASCMMWSPTT